MNRRLSSDRKSGSCHRMYEPFKVKNGYSTERKPFRGPSNTDIVSNHMLVPMLVPLKMVKFRKFSDLTKTNVKSSQVRIRKSLFRIQELLSLRSSTPLI